jgi:uncharacterized membrane protein
MYNLAGFGGGSMRHSLRLSLILSTILCAHVALPQTDAFLWTATGGMQDLGVLPGWQDSAGGSINNTGTIVGSLSKTDGDQQDDTSFGWKDSIGMHYLDGLSFTNSLPTAINNRGPVVSTMLFYGHAKARHRIWGRLAAKPAWPLRLTTWVR